MKIRIEQMIKRKNKGCTKLNLIFKRMFEEILYINRKDMNKKSKKLLNNQKEINHVHTILSFGNIIIKTLENSSRIKR